MTTTNSRGFVNFKDIIKHPIRHQGDGQDFEVCLHYKIIFCLIST